MGVDGRMSRRMQLRTLVLDRKDATWTAAHLALYIMDAVDTGDHEWLTYLNRANIAVRRRNPIVLGQVLEMMRREVGWNEEDDRFVREAGV